MDQIIHKLVSWITLQQWVFFSIILVTSETYNFMNFRLQINDGSRKVWTLPAVNHLPMSLICFRLLSIISRFPFPDSQNFVHWSARALHFSHHLPVFCNKHKNISLNYKKKQELFSCLSKNQEGCKVNVSCFIY